MAMDIYLSWLPVIELQNGTDRHPYFTCNMDKLPENPGIYVFARKHGDRICSLYIGQALNLRTRIDNQFNNAKLMNAIKNKRKSGKRVLLVGKLDSRRGQQAQRALNVIERKYIEHAMDLGPV